MASTEISLFAYEASAEKKEKSPTALRTISEAAEILDVPQHVLRFWETKFHQIKPLKRNGGRRFYRPQDIDVLQQIKHLLYNQGYTIKGAKKAIDEFIHARAERGVSHQEWLASVPPASVNDNDAVPLLTLFETAAVDESAAASQNVAEDSTSEIMAEIAEALAAPEAAVAVQPMLPNPELLAMREELVALRNGLQDFLATH